MLVDQSLVLTENQKLTAAAAGQNVIDLEEETSTTGFSKVLEVSATIVADVAGTLQVKLQECATKNGTFTDVAAGAVLTAPKKGTVIQFPMPYHTKQFLRIYFGGSPTAGTVTAFLTEGRQQWRPAKQAPSLAEVTVTEQAAG